MNNIKKHQKWQNEGRLIRVNAQFFSQYCSTVINIWEILELSVLVHHVYSIPNQHLDFRECF